MTSAFYRQYMQSVEWQAKRAQKLKQVGYRCEHRRFIFFRCKVRYWLEVHHKNYKRLGHERMSDLQALCDHHHDEADKKRQANNRVQHANA